MGNNYLADVLKASDITKCENNKICILSGVGSGKNWFVEHELIKEGNILYISSRRAKVNEILEENLAQEYISWEKEFGDVVTTTNAGIEKLVKNEKFGKGFGEIIKHFTFVVVDEAHSICSDATFTSSAFHLLAFLEYVNERYPHIKIVLMTGTPEPLQNLPKMLDEYTIMDMRNACINVVPKKIRFIKKKEAIAVMANLPKDQKTVYYTNSARSVVAGKYALVKQLIEKGIGENEICICMSEKSIKKNQQHFNGLKENCVKTKEEITKNKKMPVDTRFLFTTSTLKEGVNIKDSAVKVAFCETHIMSDVEQFAGRMREGIDILYILYGEGVKQHDVDEAVFNNYEMEMIYSARQGYNAVNGFLNEQIKNDLSGLYILTKYKSGDRVLEEYMEGDYSLFTYGGEAVKPFVEMIESRHQYLKFNHMLGKFTCFRARFIEQRRVHKAITGKGWIDDFKTYSEKHHIDYVAPVFEDGIDINSIREYLQEKVGQLLVDEERDELKARFISSFQLASKNPQKKTMNKCLAEHELPYEIDDGNTTRYGIEKRYLCVKELN